MCALIAMAVYSTDENKKDACLDKTLESLQNTVDFSRHHLMLSVNGSTSKTPATFKKYEKIIEKVIVNETNLGTAEAINLVWRHRKTGEHCVKMDDDVIIHYSGWLDEMEEALSRDTTIGQIGAKRKDCWENPNHPDQFYKSELIMLPHQPYERWIIVEKVHHVMGTCVLHSYRLLDKVGYLCQPKLYGFDDSFMSLRSNLAGFISVFLPHINIDHIDTGETVFQKWKENHASECWDEYHKTVAGYRNGTIPLYYNPFK